jgi:DNA (cytosine-5)-methyltransferase 1
MFSIGSLFSGIGGLELGLEWSGLGLVYWQVEKDTYCRSVLKKHWPHVKREIYDVTKAGYRNLERVNLICGGFPCQNISSAGDKLGLAGNKSGLWYEYLRIINEILPRWVIIENVASGANRWVDNITRDLERSDYASIPIPLSAHDIGAPHRRERIFIIGCNPNGYSEPMGPINEKMEIMSKLANTVPSWTMSEYLSVADGFPKKLAIGMRAYGNAVVPQCAEVIGHVIRLLDFNTWNRSHG